MVRRSVAAVAWLASMATACASPLAAAPLLMNAAKGDPEPIAIPQGDGSQYVAVESDRRTSSGTLRRRWVREATKACKGEYVVLSEAASSRRTDGILASRVHEGWVQCVSPDAFDQPPAKSAKR